MADAVTNAAIIRVIEAPLAPRVCATQAPTAVNNTPPRLTTSANSHG